MKLFYECKSSERMHPAYGVVYSIFQRNSDMVCLIPFNLIARPIYLVWIWLHYWPKRTRMEREVVIVREAHLKYLINKMSSVDKNGVD